MIEIYRHALVLSRARVFIALVGVLGALFGSIFARTYVAACDCGSPSWDLLIDMTTESDETLWPARARLTSLNSPQVLFDASANHDAKVDHFMGGSW